MARRRPADEKAGAAYTYTNPRTLLAIIRLSQALARLRFSTEVNVKDIEEALRLMDASRSSIIEDTPEQKGNGHVVRR